MTRPVTLSVANLSKTFRVGFWRKKVEAVHRLNFEVYDGEIFGIVGPNGAGKTTTMKMLTGLIFPDEGTVELFGESAAETSSRRRLGYLPEEPYFYDHLTVTELLHYYGSLHGVSGGEVDERLDDLLNLVGLADVPHRPLRKFSKGMRQRAGIAQALVNDPELVILDEPQSGLDPVGRKDVRDLIFRLREQGKTVIFSSHILVDVEAVCDRVAVMNEGELVEVADLDELAASRDEIVEISVAGIDRSDVDDLEGLEHLEQSGKKWLLQFEGGIDVNPTLAQLDDLGARILGVDRRRPHLEDRFLQDTRPTEAQREG